MSNHKINNGIIIQCIRDSSEEYVNNLYDSLVVSNPSLKDKITSEDLQNHLINHIFKVMSIEQTAGNLPDCNEIFDKWIVFGGSDYYQFLAKFISSFDNINLNNGLGKKLLKLCEYYDLL